MKQILRCGIASATSLTLAVFPASAQEEVSPKLSFFVTSSTHSGNLDGLQGADAICQTLATQVGAGHRVWRAYLSTHGSRETQAINARDRIGKGPWFNAKGVLIAETVADLHGDIQRDSNRIMQSTALTETAAIVPGRNRPERVANQHDILTGSDSHGRAFAAGAMRFNNLTCDNWTNGSNSGQAMVGHHDRLSSWNTSWNSSHASKGCSLEALAQTGGAGRFYCFASD
ncbi:hypothetical protein [Phaeobacter sp. 11ANDIMAR09]|uniref:hypothetical protein n=1 Tax=Phaeobacter sp. 11ANDIMAR09 TaxID=1225647 RepID=UPI0006C83B77|nr:hypothetical protein [Phaeobacter sp. 11ANDIMAR09]KPD10624.1 hypothetical protein AN476_19975 [Phaeobacter sp. 11ANDIMAR09]